MSYDLTSKTSSVTCGQSFLVYDGLWKTIKFSYCSQWPTIRIPDPPAYLNYQHAFWQSERKDCRLNGCQDGCIMWSNSPGKVRSNLAEWTRHSTAQFEEQQGGKGETACALGTAIHCFLRQGSFPQDPAEVWPLLLQPWSMCVHIDLFALGFWGFIFDSCQLCIAKQTRGSEMDSVISLVQCQNPLYVCRATEGNLIAKCFWWQNWPAGDNSLEKQEKESKMTFSF